MSSPSLLVDLIRSKTANIVCEPVQLAWPVTIQAKLGGESGSVSAVVSVFGSNDEYCLTNQDDSASSLIKSFYLYGTSGADALVAVDTDECSPIKPYAYYWASVAGLSGTGATVSVSAAAG